ncbi:MAG TPA: SRPBCC family protein [Steroidobacteraceae bacterium]|nr:SRPBCC family protein [Steroidobacteraceae bacterium]
MSEQTFTREYSESAELRAPPEQVFSFLDDFEHLGAHMTRPNRMMAGSSMRYEFDAARGRAVGAGVRLIGSFLGQDLEIEEFIDDREPPLRKSWRTVGAPRMLVLAAYHMGFAIERAGAGSRLTVFIDYALPASGAGRRILGRLLGGVYARWCVRQVLAAAVDQFNEPIPKALGAPQAGKL